VSKLLIPNTTQVPNILLDKVMPLLPEAPLKALLVIARFTYGFQKYSDKIGFGQLAKATGLERRSVIRAVKFLSDLIRVKVGGPGIGANEYSLNLDITEAQFLALNQRRKKTASDPSDTSDSADTSDFGGKKVVTPVTPS
jgi:Bacteriophage replication protein O